MIIFLKVLPLGGTVSLPGHQLGGGLAEGCDVLTYEKPKREDLTLIGEQLKREPRGVLGINRFCKFGFPQVITNRPLIVSGQQIEVFPTLYWLTCPYLRREVAFLEGEGIIGQFEQKIREDPDFAEAVQKNHRDYAQRRLALIPIKVRSRMQLEYPERYRVLAESGVGGVRTGAGVKCLHAHLSDYLVRGKNVIGAEVSELLNGCLNCAAGQCSSFLE